MIPDTSIQVLRASTPTLKMIERVVALRNRRDGTNFVGERTNSSVEVDRLCTEWRLGGAWLRAYAPPKTGPGPEDVLEVDGLPWYLSNLAVIATSFCGFKGHRPWRAGRAGGAPEWAMRLFGTVSAVDSAKALYAALALVCTVKVRYTTPKTRNEFLLGVSMGIGQAFMEASQFRFKQEQNELRTQMIVRPEEQPDVVDFKKSLETPRSPLHQGIQASAGLWELALKGQQLHTNYTGYVVA